MVMAVLREGGGMLMGTFLVDFLTNRFTLLIPPHRLRGDAALIHDANLLLK